MAILYREITKLLNVLEKFYYRDMHINVYILKDFNNFIKNQLIVDYTGCINKDIYHVKFTARNKKYIVSTNLNLEFSCNKSNYDKILIDKSKMLSHKLLKVKIFFKNYEELFDSYAKIVPPRVQKFKKYDKSEWIMCIPPGDKSNPNYKNYLKQYFKVCEENPKLFIK